MTIEVTAEVNYTCYLDDDKSKLVMDYANENNCTLEEAVWQLQFCNPYKSIEIYDNSVESDFSTESIDNVELTPLEEEYFYKEDNEDEEDDE